MRRAVVAGDQSVVPLPPRQTHAASANPPEWPKGIIARHDAYWRNEANMEEGNPMLALERGEKVALPPAVWFQGSRRRRARLQGPRIRASPATSRSGFAPTTRRPAAISRSSTSRWNATPAIRRTSASAARCSPTWSTSSASTSGSELRKLRAAARLAA